LKTGIIESRDNFDYCVLYGKNQPEKGRIASSEEISKIRQWIREEEQIRFVEQNEELPITDCWKIVIHLIHGESIQLFSLEEDNVYLIGPFDDKRILKQNLLREFIMSL
jgi:hypothetical protein